MPTYQFIRLQGYPRGPASKKGTAASVLAEGRREPSHSRHVDAPEIEVTPVDAEWETLREYQAWIEATMAQSISPQSIGGKVVDRRVRSDATAIGTVIASLPTETRKTPIEKIRRFREECIDWFRGYLDKAGMRLNYCVLHLDEKYPHLHLWFTPGREMLSRREWAMSSVTNPSIRIKQNLRQDFYREIGRRYVDELEKPKEERRRRIPSRAVAAANRLPPGEPNSEGTVMGLPVDRSGTPLGGGIRSAEISPGIIERTPFYTGTIRRMIEVVLQQRQQVGSLTEEEIIRLLAERSGASEPCFQEIINIMLQERHTSGEDTSRQARTSSQERLNRFKENSSGGLSPTAGASDASSGDKEMSLLDRFKAGQRYTGNNPPER